jgi:imidazolonepropionase
VSSLLITGIGRLVSYEPDRDDRTAASILCEDGRVAWVGGATPPEQAGAERIDVGGRCVIPGFVDSHTHLVFAGDRMDEYTARLAGHPYAAGGINTTVRATRAAARRRWRSSRATGCRWRTSANCSRSQAA